MRYASGHKEQTRVRMVETASRVLRRDGISAAGLASLMAEAIEDYSILHLAGDMVSLLNVLSIDRAAIVGHD